MAEIPVPHFHISGIHASTTVLAVIVLFGTAHLFAAAHPDSKLSQAWTNGLGF